VDEERNEADQECDEDDDGDHDGGDDGRREAMAVVPVIVGVDSEGAEPAAAAALAIV
jgi:hypothetical protein